MEEMANVLFGVEYSHLYYSYYYTYHDFISTTEPVSYGGFNIQITAVPSKYVDDLSSGNSPEYNSIHTQLRNAKDGTNVLLSLDTQNVGNFNDIFKLYGKLADKYSNLNFYAISLIGVDQTMRKILNSNVKEFNTKMETRITAVEFPNLKYKNILNENETTQIIVDGKVVDIITYSTDGLGFFKNGYIKIFNAMVEGLDK